MERDSIVEEVRRVCHEIATESGYDSHKLMERQIEFAAKWKGRLVPKEDLLATGPHRGRR